MSRISRVLIATLLALAPLSACKSKERAEHDQSKSEPGTKPTIGTHPQDTGEQTTTTTPADRTGPPGQPATVPGPGSGTTTGEPTTPGKMADNELAPAGGATLTDNQIVAVGATGNKLEIDLAELAKSKSKHAEVQKLAQMMIDDHSKGLAEGKALATKLGLAPEDTEMVATMKTKAAATAEQLNAQDGDAFDLAYVNEVIRGHQAKLERYDRELLPSVTNPELKAHLQAGRKTSAMHLDHAKMVEQALRKPS